MKKLILLLPLFLALAVSPVWAAFPTHSASPTQETAMRGSLGAAKSIKSRATSLRLALAAGSVDMTRILRDIVQIYRLGQKLHVYKNVPGVVQYAKDQYNDQGYDIAAEFIALIAAIDAVVDEGKKVPEDASGYAQVMTVGGAAGEIDVVYRMASPAETATLRTLLQALEDAIQ